MSAEEVAAWICQALRDAGVVVTLTGGACVSIWSEGKYVSRDLDFVEEGPVPRQQVRKVLKQLGFKEKRRHFLHPDTEFFVEFPTGPLMVGNQRVENVIERKISTGSLRLLSPTDCIKDRLAAFYHWNDLQSLEQALMVARAQKFELADVRRWSKAESKYAAFRKFERLLKTSPKKRKAP